MRDTTIARNYAEALVTLARASGDLDGWGSSIRALADAVAGDTQLSNFLAAPSVAAADKNRVLEKALKGKVPPPFVRFVQKLVDNRRQMLLGEIAVEYGNLVDEAEGRVHAQVTVAREQSEAERTTLVDQLSRRLGRKVVPHFTVNPAILGGIIVRVGDTVMDGSIRRRLSALRSQLLAAPASRSA